MDPLPLLDEWLVLLGASLWLQLHATPMVWLFALGLVLLAAALLIEVCAAVRADLAVVVPASTARRPVRARIDATGVPALRTIGSCGPRAPGHRMPRPARTR